MVKIYGIIKRTGYAIGAKYDKILISTTTPTLAAEILKDYRKWVNRWNDNHVIEIHGIVIEAEV